MSFLEKVPAALILQDGQIFYGFSAGKIGTTGGELCFNTGVTGYQEVFTDPSYKGQLMVTTHVHIGNYGVRNLENESNKVQISGLICRNFQLTGSRALADDELQEFLVQQGLVAITNVDTRAVVRHLRTHGAMNGIISSETANLKELLTRLQQVPSMEGLELSSQVSTKEVYDLGAPNNPKVAVIDYGVKNAILQCLVNSGVQVRVFPHHVTASQLSEWGPSGILLSNGPGDPAAMIQEVVALQSILKLNLPVMGICLGHQLMALAHGLKTKKMHHGHRGINHPVKNLETGLCEITSQNHGFTIDEESLSENPSAIVTHINLNDHTIEGLKYKDTPFFSVQYHPEASPGPHDSRYLFNHFTNLLT